MWFYTFLETPLGLGSAKVEFFYPNITQIDQIQGIRCEQIHGVHVLRIFDM